MEGGHQAEGVVAVVTAVTQEEPVLVAAAATQEAHVQVHLRHPAQGVRCRVTLAPENAVA